MDTLQWRTFGARMPVESSSLASIGYDPASRTLDIEFRKGSVYRYFEVLPSVYESLMQAPSKGRFFVAEIRDRFRYARVGAPHLRCSEGWPGVCLGSAMPSSQGDLRSEPST